MSFFELYIKKPNKRRTLIAENLSKRGWVTRPQDGPPWSRQTVMASIILYFTNPSSAFFSTLDEHVWRSVSSRTIRRVYPFHKTLTSWNMGTGTTSLIIMTIQQDGTLWLWRSVMSFRNPTLSQTSPSSFSSFTTMLPTGRHKLDRPS